MPTKESGATQRVQVDACTLTLQPRLQRRPAIFDFTQADRAASRQHTEPTGVTIMPITVSACLSKFREDYVDLPTTTSQTARSSRDFLYGQIKTLSATHTILQGECVSFGSFARRTKMRPLDDIDCFARLTSSNTKEHNSSAYTYNLHAAKESPLWIYSDSNDYVNSTEILNAVKNALGTVSQYGSADVGRDGSAVVLGLKSYTWSFDVVPACLVSSGESSWYLIPDGSGRWKRTDPRIDATRSETASKRHKTYFLPAARILKYWNRKGGKPRLPSYYFETLLTTRALAASPYASLQNAVADLMLGVKSTVRGTCADPKGHEPNLDTGTSWETQCKVYDAASAAYDNLSAAITQEIAGNHKSAISYYRAVFGTDFPAYG